MTPLDLFLAVAVQFLWGFGFVAAKPAVAHFPPLMLMGIMYLVTLVCLPHKLLRVRTPFLPLLLIATFVATVQGALIFSSLAALPASTSILLLQTQVPFSVLFSWMLSGERPSLVRMIGIVVAFSGVVIVAGAPSGVTSWWPAIMVTLGSASWSFGQAAAHRYSRDAGMTLTVGISAMAILQVAVLSAVMEHGQLTAVLTATPRIWALVAVFSLGGFVLAYAIWYGLLRRYRVDQVIPFGLLMPVAGVLGSFVFLDEPISTSEVVGGIIILAGLAIVVGLKAPAARAAVQTR
jgi:O-acetylserine/cysteine efflux transporter